MQNNIDQYVLFKDTIFQLYSKEGRSKVYIAKLLGLNRKTMTEKIKEWEFPIPKPKRHLNPSNQKFLNKHKNLIKSRLDNNIPIEEISSGLGVQKSYLLKTIIYNDDILKKAYDDYKNRLNMEHESCIQELCDKSSHIYDIVDFEDEEWKEIKGYNEYMISNHGRIKSYAERYKKYYLLTPQPNKNKGRLYVMLSKGKKHNNLQVSRLVGFSFVEGHSSEKNTINHKDGKVDNNYYKNLEWVSQSENNAHAYHELNRSKVNFKKYDFKKIIYNNKFEFKTVAAFAKFIGKSETQTRRYLDEPERHNIKLIV